MIKNQDLPYERDLIKLLLFFSDGFGKIPKLKYMVILHHNDSKVYVKRFTFRLDHSRSLTLGLRKLFDSKRNNSQFEFQWEWTQMEQTGSRLIRNAGSGTYTTEFIMATLIYREVTGVGIGPGSNSQYFSVANHDKNRRIGLAFEMIDQDNDFYYYAFEENEIRRYWKDFTNIYEKKFKKFWDRLIFYTQEV